MTIQQIFIISGLLFASICYLVAKWNTHGIGRLNVSDEESEGFLYDSLSVFSVAISNVGSTISFYVMVVGAILMTFGWGSLLLICSVIAVISSFAFLWVLLLVFSNDYESLSTYIDLLQDKFSTKKALFSLVFMTIFAISTIGSEIQALKILYNSMCTPVEMLIAGTIENQGFNFNIFISIICILYVFKGGFSGVIRTDILQIVFIAIAWVMCVYWIRTHANFGDIISQTFLFNKETVVVSLATMALTFGWIVASLDTWIRSIDSLRKRYNDKVEYRRKLNQTMLATIILSVMVVSVPLFVGLTLRQAVIDSYSDGGTTVSGWSNPALTAEIEQAFRKQKPLTYRGNETDGGFLPPEARDGNGSMYESYTTFTNIPYIISSIVSSNLFISSFKSNDTQNFILVFFIFIAAILAATLTTIDTLIILIPQLLFKIYIKIKHKTRISRHLFQPTATIPLLSAVILFFSFSSLYSDKLYLSAGIFAWSCMPFLAGTCIFPILVKDKPVRVEKVIAFHYFFFCVWLLLVVSPHAAISAGWINHENFPKLLDFLSRLLLADRSIMAIMSFVPIIICSIALGFASLIDKFKTKEVEEL